MKMYDEIKKINKEYVYDRYIRIVDNSKDYDKITKVKMLDAIYDIYSDYNNIIEICTSRELKYLKMVLDNKLTLDNLLEDENLNICYLDKKYEWERETLRNKFLLDYDYYNESHIPEEVLDKVKAAVKNVNWKEKAKNDELIEILVGYCKTVGSSLLSAIASFGSSITDISKEVIWNFLLNNKLFGYYVCIISRDFENLGDNLPVAVYWDYYEIENDLFEQRKLQGITCDRPIDIKYYKRLFYNDFDFQNPKIKKFLDELEKLPFFWFQAIEIIREYAMLNIDRKQLKMMIQSVPSLKYKDLSNLFKLMDEAMDEMPSGALNGLTPNEANKIRKLMKEKEIKKEQKYIKQKNACLSEKDAKLFYKIYFALLEFTNQKYKVNDYIKIYNKKNINPYEIKDIVEKFWENKEKIVLEFSLDNPYKFTKEELELVSEFKKGIRDIFVIVKYELEYTSFLHKDRVYMVKGLNDNIDNVILYKKLPCAIVTSLIPFKNHLIYDGIIMEIGIKMGLNFEDVIEVEYNNLMKYYHL